jgi:hypothetical protein
MSAESPLTSQDRLVLLAQLDDPEPGADGEESSDGGERPESAEPGSRVTPGITSHVFSRSGVRAFSKSTFLPPSTTDAVWTRVAFFDGAGARLVLSPWRNLGSGNPYRTVLFTWHLDDQRARRAVVLWNMNGDTWNRWAPA